MKVLFIVLAWKKKEKCYQWQNFLCCKTR